MAQTIALEGIIPCSIFHFHGLSHTYTGILLSNGAAPQDVQKLLGHSDVNATMNVYAHASREAKRSSTGLLDKVAGKNSIHSEKSFPCELPIRSKTREST